MFCFFALIYECHTERNCSTPVIEHIIYVWVVQVKSSTSKKIQILFPLKNAT